MSSSQEPARPAVLLLSGGLDSTTLLALAVSKGFLVHALSFRYGQRHDIEVQAAKRAAERYGALKHVVLDIDLLAKRLHLAAKRQECCFDLSEQH